MRGKVRRGRGISRVESVTRTATAEAIRERTGTEVSIWEGKIEHIESFSS
jgi:hypothetical protein